MASKRRDEGQIILLAGILLVLAYLLFSTQSALLATVGQEAGREASQPLFNDYIAIRNSISQLLEAELTNAAGTAVNCPTSGQEWAGRVETLLSLLSQLEANRGQAFKGDFISTAQTAIPGNRETIIDLYLTNGDATVMETTKFITACT